MIEIFVFNPDCRYGMGMMGDLLKETTQHRWVRFMSINIKDKIYSVIVISTSIDGKTGPDDEGIKIHMMV
jgi:hypothetical protein